MAGTEGLGMQGGWIQPVAQAAGGLLGQGLGMATANAQDRRQYHQQKKLTAVQMKAMKEMGKYNQELAYDMWQRTGPAAQRKQLEAAGLNVGLMYEGAGPGGATAQPGSASGGNAAPEIGHAGMGMMMGGSIAQMMAEIALKKAQTENIQADTEKKKTVDTEAVKSTIAQLAATTNNEKLKGVLMNLDADLKTLEVEKANKSMEDSLKAIKEAANKAEAEARSADIKAGVDQATQDTTIKTMRTAATEQALRIMQQKKNLTMTDQQIRKIANDINIDKQGNLREWDKLTQKDKEIIFNQIAEDQGLVGGQGAVHDLMSLIF